ncbi:bacteriocin-protection protein, partial [bacterium]
MGKSTVELEIILFATPEEWVQWLEKNGTESDGIWVRFAKKASELKSIDYTQAMEGALCYGWIDGQKLSHDADSYLLKFTPRRARSIWSKINRDKALALIENGKMQLGGLKEVE